MCKNEILINPSIFVYYADHDPDRWRLLEGHQITHVLWGTCNIEFVNFNSSTIQVSGHKVAIEYFRDEIFSNLVFPVNRAKEITELGSIRKQEKDKEKLDKEMELQEKERKHEQLRREIAQLAADRARREEERLARLRMLEDTNRRAEEERKIREAKKQEEARIAQETRLRAIKEKQLPIVCSQYYIREFYHLTHVDNLEGIIQKGLLCHNKVGKHIDISNSKIQAGRHHKFLPMYPGRTIHDCVPLFISPKPPMLYVQQKEQEQIVYLRINPKILLLSEVVFTDGNARSNDTQFFDDLEKLNHLDWDLLHRQYWGSDDPEQHQENKRRRSAEVLVPNQIPHTYFTHITVYNKEIYSQVQQILAKLSVSIPTRIETRFYYNIHNSKSRIMNEKLP